MKVKKLLPILLSVITFAFVLSGCSEFDNGWTEKELKYRENFANAFGKIDPEQDWNLATRAAVTVTTGSPTDVKIFAKTDGTYRIVADYADVTGTQKLGFDMREDVTDLIVTNGSQSFYVKPGEDVAFGATTRAIYETNADGINVAGVKAEEYVEFDADLYVSAVVDADGVLPESSSNLKKVTQNFSYISNGPFTIHPIYWLTSSNHILGVYWKEGNTYHYQDVYKDKDAAGKELATSSPLYKGECEHYWKEPTVGMSCKWSHGEITRVAHDSEGFHMYKYDKQYCREYGKNVGEVCTLHSKKIDGDDGTGTYHDSEAEMTCDLSHFDITYNVGDICPTCGKILHIDGESSKKYTIIDPNYTGIGEAAPTNGKIYSKGITINLPVGTLFGFYLKVYNGSTYYHTLYSQGELNKSKRGNFFDPDLISTGGCSVRTNGLNKEGTEAWAATFQHKIGDQTVQYLCFEDWSVEETDLNDLVFATPVTDGYTPPSIVDEDATAWIICAEDLGNNFDIDYNDVVVEVKHVSGSTTATVSPIAAGGTLASYIYFNDATGGTQCLGEVHELLGQANNESGKYTPINVDGNVNTSIIKDYKFNVANDWSIASSTVGDANFSEDAAMGGFTVKVVPQGTQASESAATIQGQTIQNSTNTGTVNVPFLFCVPRDWNRIEGTTKYSSWFRWSKELTPMSPLAGYNKVSYNTDGHTFAAWVANHNDAQDWYKYPNLDNTVGVLGITETQVSVDPGNGSSPEPTEPTTTTGFTIATQSESVNYGTAFKVTVTEEAINTEKRGKITVTYTGVSAQVFLAYSNGSEIVAQNNTGNTNVFTIEASALSKISNDGSFYVGAFNTGITVESVIYEVVDE